MALRRVKHAILEIMLLLAVLLRVPIALLALIRLEVRRRARLVAWEPIKAALAKRRVFRALLAPTPRQPALGAVYLALLGLQFRPLVLLLALHVVLVRMQATRVIKSAIRALPALIKARLVPRAAQLALRGTRAPPPL